MSKQTEALKLALEAHRALREWINAVPKDTPLPAIPGIDGDWLDEVDATIREALAEQPAQEYIGGGLSTPFGYVQRAKQPTIAFEHPIVQIVYEILCSDESPPRGEHWEGFTARRIVEALAEQPAQQQEPVAWMIWTHGPVLVFMNKDEASMEFVRLNHAYPEPTRMLVPLYTSPPASKPWVGLTPEQRASIAEANNMLVDDDLFDDIEAKLREKNA